MASLIRTELLLSVLLLAPAVMASPLSEARAAAKAAKQAYDLGHFGEAVEQYEKAYALKPADGLLFNLGQSHRRVGNAERALFYFRRYLETNPPRVQAAATEQVITEVQAQLDAQRAAQNAETERVRLETLRQQEIEDHARQVKLEQARRATAQAEAEAAQRKLALEASLKQAPQTPPVTQRWWFWTAVGAAVAGATVATVVATAPQPTPTTLADINAR